jgi:hypothetical protein
MSGLFRPKPLERLARYEIATEPRRKPQRIKEAIVRFKRYPNKKLVGETLAEFDYQPLQCRRSYRLVVVRQDRSLKMRTITRIRLGKPEISPPGRSALLRAKNVPVFR